MATQLQMRRGTQSEHTSFTGAEGEVSVNTTNESLHVHNGSAAGGFELARADLDNVSDSDLNAALTGNTIGSLTITTAGITNLSLGGVSVTSTAAELNILDGVTSTAAELNILDGVTSTTAELNILDGVTASTAELNFVDGVTSAIQTQIDTKAPLASPAFTGTVTAAGNVGLGLTPSSWAVGKAVELGFEGNAVWGNAADEMIVVQNGYYDGAWKYATTNQATHYSQYDGNHRWFTAPSGTADSAISWTQAMTLSNSGSVGIGTSSPDSPLEIDGGSTDNTVLHLTSGTANTYLKLSDSNSTNGTFIGATTNDLNFYPNNSLAVTMTASGSVGIGTSSVSAPLHLKSSTANAISIQENGSATTGTGQASRFISTTSNVTDVIDSNGYYRIGSSTNPVTGAGFAERMRILSTGGITFNGDTAQANALNDYESGTWTPTISGCTITVQRANYVKIGGLVHLSFTMNINSSDGSSTQISIGGVPFTASVANVESTATFMAENVNFPSGTIMANLYKYSQAGIVSIYATLQNSSLTAVLRSALSSSSTLWGSIVFQTDD